VSKTKVCLSDLHVGGLTDFWNLDLTIEKVIDRLKRYRVDRIELVLLGDVHEGQGMYETQVTSVRGVFQSFAGAGLVYSIVERFRDGGIGVEKVVIAQGNHDRRLHEGLSLSQHLLMALEDMQLPCRVEVYDYYIEDGVLYRHAILLGSGGSYIYGISPRMISAATKICEKYGVEKVVAGHVHKFGMVKLHKMDAMAVTIPSFQIDFKREENDRGVLIILDGFDFLYVEPDKKYPIMAKSQEEVFLDVLKRAMEYIDLYRKVSGKFQSCNLIEVKARPRGWRGNTKWVFAILRDKTGRRRFIDYQVLENVARVYEASDATREAIKIITRMFGVNETRAHNLIWMAINEKLCEPKRPGRGRRKRRGKAEEVSQ